MASHKHFGSYGSFFKVADAYGKYDAYCENMNNHVYILVLAARVQHAEAAEESEEERHLKIPTTVTAVTIDS